MPWWVSIVNAFIQSVHPWCQILLSTSWCDAICYKNAILPLVKHYHGIKGELAQFTIEICQLNIDKRCNEWSINNFKNSHVFFLCSLICLINVSMMLDHIYISVLNHMCMYYVLNIMYHLFLICPKGCINCNTSLVPMFNHHLPLPWCLDTQSERHVLPNETTIHLYPSFLIVKHWINVLLNIHIHTLFASFLCS